MVRESKEASNFPVRETTEHNPNVRARHIGHRERYNGKFLGTNYNGGKRNSTALYMFFNFPNDWGMGKLWMIFKKYGTVFDMFIVQKRLRNGQRYGFVRFKHVVDVEGLLMKLRQIRLGEDTLRVFVAFDRRNEGNRFPHVREVEEECGKRRGMDGVNRNNVRFNKCDNRHFIDVVNGENWNRMKTRSDVEGVKRETAANVDGNNSSRYGVERKEERMLEVNEDEIDFGLLSRSLIGEVKKLCYLPKLPGLCEEVGINKVEVKWLGGLEVMIAFENKETTGNIMNNVNHEIRRWLHKLRRWNSSYSPSGRMTWLNIIGVPISCWAESVFKRIAGLHGIIVETKNCRLEGNQNVIYGKVLIHTTAKDLINESLSIKCIGKSFKIKVIEEVRDISYVDIEENNEVNQTKNEPEKGEDLKGMEISDGEGGESGEDSNGDEDSSDEEENRRENNNRGGGFRPSEIATRNIGVEEESRVSIGTKVRDSFEDDDGCFKKKMAAENNETTKGLGDKEENSIACDDKNEEANCSKNKEVNVQDSECIINMNNGSCELEVPNKGMDVGPMMDEEFIAHVEIKSGLDGGKLNTQDFGLEGNKKEQVIDYTMGPTGGSQRQKKSDHFQPTNMDKEDIIVDDTIIRAEKREGSPSIVFGSGGERSRKKRKANIESVMEEDKITYNFDQGLGNDKKNSGRTKIGIKSVKKTIKIARQMGMTRLCDDTKGMHDAYKEFHTAVEENKGVFVFRGSEQAESDNKSCNISVEQVKEIGEMIGVSWALAEEESLKIGANIVYNEAGNGTVGNMQ
ncbi:hypothetical protein CTI12_AA126710 [Artemisia annua]|uniref:RRM domain-containing protein n=1 Tax=Artemisia annua TaxID=35608 RepID=A0A2U1PPW4_ARTAN|nr:hypothetical protein CTI12_AA126710 [Artemisia annua]